MMNLTQLAETTPLLYLSCPQTAIQQAEQEAANHSNNSTAWNAYLNALSSATLLPWLQETSGETCTSYITEISSLWDILDGTALQMGDTRLVIIPLDEEDCDTFSISQEWVDIPEFAADYYLFVHLELDESEEDCGLEFLGYATHRDCKEMARYNAEKRLYELPLQDLTDDISLLFLARQFVGSRQVELSPLPSLSATQARKLLKKLSESDAITPRLLLPFPQWGALISNSQWRQELYQQRLSQVTASNPSAEVLLSEQVVDVATPLQSWFNTVVNNVQTWTEQSWQTVDELLETLGQPEFAYRFAGTPRFRDEVAGFPQAVPGLLALLRSNPDKETTLSTLYLLGQIGYGHQEAIAALSEQRETATDGDIRRQAAVSLGKIDPTNPQAGVRRVKVIDFGMRFEQTQVSLIITLLPEENEKVNIHLRVCPLGEAYLPERLKLAILDEMGQTLRQEETRRADIAMQLSFRGQKGDHFGIKVSLDEYSMTERFVI